MRSPLTIYGGKYYMVKNLSALMPPHDYYVEVFGGAAWLLFAKPPAKVETYNDVNGEVVNFFRVLRDPKLSKRLRRAIAYTPYSRAEYYACRESPTVDDPVERARRFFVLCRMSFSGNWNGTGWGFSITSSTHDMAGTCSRFHAARDTLRAACRRLRNVQIECRDWRFILSTYRGPGYLAYCDPPYVNDTRVGGDRYEHELSNEDHAELTKTLLAYDGMVMLSGYRHPIHAPLEAEGWKRYDFSAHSHAVARTRAVKYLNADFTARGKRTESVWLNPAAEAANNLLFQAGTIPEKLNQP